MAERLFKLDCNIDGYYSDINNNIQPVENFIQVVNGADGSSQATPDIYGRLGDTTGITDLTTKTSISGSGVIFNINREIVGEKGNLIIRDNLKNEFSFRNFKISTMEEATDKQVYMRDQSVSQYLVSETSQIALDSLVNGAGKTVVSPGNGNLVQIARKDTQNKSKVYIDTVNLSESNIVVVTGKVLANKETTFDLVDIYPGNETVLATVYFTPRRDGYSKPVFINWSGTLAFYELNQDGFDYYEEATCEESVTKEDEERVTIYNNYYKRHFMKSDTDTNFFTTRTHRLALRSRDGSNFEYGDLNIIAFDGNPPSTIREGVVEVAESDSVVVSFDALPLADYSVSIVTSGFVETWYSAKKVDGFTINLERKFTGKIYWTAVYNEIKELE